MRTIDVHAIEFEDASKALQHIEASGRGRAIHCGGKFLVVETSEAERLEAAGGWRTFPAPVVNSAVGLAPSVSPLRRVPRGITLRGIVLE